ncbi:MAG: rhodanese-like domain-containing protein [Deltaproteobacteria bacterium]|nr:rhodanese-like domain-containing protein [Deltaproteobacteria bacterium]
MRLPLALAVVVACASPPPPVDDDDFDDVDATLAPLVLDVRTEAEWDRGHLEDAWLIPLDELADSLADLDRVLGGDRERPIVVVCGTGRRAEKARAFLRTEGFPHVSNGGAWWACASLSSASCASRGLHDTDETDDVDDEGRARSMESFSSDSP